MLIIDDNLWITSGSSVKYLLFIASA